MKKLQVMMKRDTLENWRKATNFIPKEGEVIVYEDVFPIGIKMGDGKTLVNDLPFITNYNTKCDGEILIFTGEDQK